MKRFLVVLLAFCAGSTVAQVPSGAFSYLITDPPLWDATGSYTNSVATNGYTDAVTMDISVAANGKITGDRQDHLVQGSNSADINGIITGKVSLKRGIVTGNLKNTGTVTGIFEGHGFTGTAKGKAIVTLDLSSSNVVVNGSVKISPKGGKSQSFAGIETSPLPPGVNGDWALDTDIAATGSKLSGTGTVTLSNGRDFTYLITGSYKTTTEVAKLKLVGQGDAAGSSLSLTTQGTNMDVTALKGKVLGLTLKSP